METSETKSVYLYGAKYGRWTGIYLIAMSACLVASLRFPSTLFIMSLMLAGLPVVLYALLRRMYMEAPANRTFSALWMGGIMTMLCGTLICAIVTAAWLLLAQPHFFEQYMAMAIRMGENSPNSADYAAQIEILKKGLESGVAPSPMRFVVSMIWTSVFLGSMLSMFCAWILRMRRPELKSRDRSDYFKKIK